MKCHRNNYSPYYDRKGTIATYVRHKKIVFNAITHGKTSNYLFLSMTGIHEIEYSTPRRITLFEMLAQTVFKAADQYFIIWK